MTRFMNDFWLSAARSATDDQLRVFIDAAADTEDKFQYDVETIRTCARATGIDTGQSLQILDFGCGIGRNVVGIAAETRWTVVGYDSTPMLERARPWLASRLHDLPAAAGRVKLTSDWQGLRGERFACVLATLVLQHIYEQELASYLDDLRHMTPVLVVHGRRLNDDSQKNTWEILHRSWRPILSPPGFTLVGDPQEHHTVVWAPRDESLPGERNPEDEGWWSVQNSFTTHTKHEA